jgi:alpha-aminoadipic semialdehyde synthase
MRIGIRREDKNRWEARVPLIPDDVDRLIRQGIEVWLQPSSIRTYSDDDYRKVGAIISEDLSGCPVILAVKEIPADFFQQGKTYVFFSHTIKGQKDNMPMLKRMMDLKCQLIDYELVTDEQGRRLIFFGRHAGLAGMIDTLWALGKRLHWEGVSNPFEAVKTAHEYRNLDDAKVHITDVGKKIARKGIPQGVAPLICGFAGYGHVSQGAQEIFDLLPYEEIAPAEVAQVRSAKDKQSKKLYKVVFKEEDMVEPVEPGGIFDLQDYYHHPEKYRSRFENYLPHLTVLVNCIYWDDRYPRLVTLDYLKRAYSGSQPPPLKVVGDISCDIEGSVQCTVKATDPGDPVYVYNPLEAGITMGWEGDGIVVMAVDNLPCELAREASAFFSKVLTPFVDSLAAADYRVPYENVKLPGELHRAMILHQGKLTPKYQHLSKYL